MKCKLIRIFALALSINSISLWSWAGNEITRKESTGCAMALNTPHSLIEHFADQSKQRADQLKEWASLTSADPNSAISQAMEALKVLSSQNASISAIGPTLLNKAQSQAAQALDQLKRAERLLDKALIEINDVIYEENELIRASKGSSSPATESQKKESDLLALRIQSLLQIKTKLEEHRVIASKIFLQLRNQVDLAHPYFLNDGMDRMLSEMFWVEPSSINMGVDSGQSSRGFEISNSKPYGIKYFNTVSLQKKHELSKKTMEKRLREYLQPAESWKEYSPALKRFAPFVSDPNLLVGQSITLIQFPNSWSPDANFIIESYDRDDDSLQIVLPNGEKLKEKAERLLKSQIQLHLLRDIKRLISQDKPVLVYTGTPTSMALTAITEVSISDRTFRGVSVESEKSDGQWYSYTSLRGIPLNVVTKEDPLVVTSQQPFGYARLLPDNNEAPIRDEISLITQVIYSGKAVFWKSSARSLSEKDQSALKTSTTKSSLSSKAALTLTEQLNELLAHIEPKGFYKERALQTIELMRNQRALLAKTASSIEEKVKLIDEFKHPSLLQRMGSSLKKSLQLTAALNDLPFAISRGRWLLKNHLSSERQSEVIVREILEVLQNYKTMLANFDTFRGIDKAEKEGLKLFLNERVVLLTKMVQKMASDQKRLQQEVQRLQVVLHHGTILAEENKLDIPNANIYIEEKIGTIADNPNVTAELLKPLLYSGQDYRDLLEQLFSDDVKTLTETFSPKPKDFPRTFKFAETYSQLKLAMSTERTNIPEFKFEGLNDQGMKEVIDVRFDEIKSNYYLNIKCDSLGPDELKQGSGEVLRFLDKAHRKIFVSEFLPFMQKHRVLYSPLDNRFILNYNQRHDQFTVLSRDGVLSKAKLEDVPIWRFEKLKEGLGIRSLLHYPTRFTGFGHTFDGERIYFSRSLEENNEVSVDSYPRGRIEGDIQTVKMLEEGEKIPGTTLEVEKEVFLVDPEIERSMKKYLQGYSVSSREDRVLSIPKDFFAPFIRFGKPITVTESGEIIFFSEVRQNIYREFTVTPQELKHLQIQKLSNLNHLKDPIVTKLLSEFNEHWNLSNIYWVKVPVGEGKSSYLVFNTNWGTMGNWECQSFFIVSEELRHGAIESPGDEP